MDLLNRIFVKRSAFAASAVVVLSFLFMSSGSRLHITTDPTAFRWRNDNGTEAAATFSADEGEPLGALTKNTPARLCFSAANSGAGSDPVREAALTLETGGPSTGGLAIRCTAGIDTTDGYAYYATNTSPTRVIKVALGSGTTAPNQIASLTLATGENSPGACLIDTVNRYVYIGTNNKVVKVSFGAGAAAPTKIGTLTLNGDEFSIGSGLIDAGNGYAYFGAGVARRKRLLRSP